MEKIGGLDLNVSTGPDSKFLRRLIVIFNYNVFVWMTLLAYIDCCANKIFITPPQK